MNRIRGGKFQMIFRSALLAVGALCLPEAHAQGRSEAPANLAGKGGDPRLSALAGAHGLSQQEARRQLALTDMYQQQIDSLVEDFRDDYLQSIFNYGQGSNITLVFARDVSLPAVQQALPAELRPIVRVKRSRLDRQSIMDTKANILAELKPYFDGVG